MKQKTSKILLIMVFAILLSVSVVGKDIYFFAEEDDFNEGNYYNTVFESGALTLLDDIKNPKFLWVANSGEASVSKIDTDQNKEVARYNLDASGGQSRTAVDIAGNVWVGSRYNDKKIHKIAAFKENCVDRNDNGVIETSTDSNPLSYTYDECVIFFIESHCSGTGPRSLAIDLDSNVWVGCWTDQKYQKYDSQTGELIDEYSISGSNPYGAAVDSQGRIWSLNRGGNNVMQIDADTGAILKKIHVQSPYGIAIDSDDTVWVSSWNNSETDALLHRLRPENDYALESFRHPEVTQPQGRGVVVDSDSNIWVTDSRKNRVYKFNTRLEEFTCDLRTGDDPIGVVMDNAGFIWVVNRHSSNTKKINPATCESVAEVLTGQGPYTYSDATGSGLYQFVNSGTWTYDFEDLSAGSSITWIEQNNQDDSIKLELSNETDNEEITNGEQNTVTGPVRVTITLTRNSDGSSPSIDEIRFGPSGELVCQEDIPFYYLFKDFKRTVDLNDIFKVEGDPGDVTNLIENSGTEKLIVEPKLSDFEMDVEPKTTEVFETRGYFTLETDKGYTSETCAADFSTDTSELGEIVCAAVTPQYKLYEGESLDIPIQNIWTIIGPDPGAPISVVQTDSSGVTITPGFPTHVTATPNGIDGFATAHVRLLTDNGLISPLCPIEFTTGDDFGKIDCVPEPPHQRRLYLDESLDMPFSQIFVFSGDYGNLTQLEEVSGTNGLDITPHLEEYYMSVLPTRQIRTTGFFKLTTEKNVRSPSCPAAFSTHDDDFDDIYCRPIPPEYVVQDDHVLTVDLTEVFVFENDIGRLNYIKIIEGGDSLNETPRYEERELDVEKNGPMPDPVDAKIKVKTTYGIRATCPAEFENLDAKCDQSKCNSCFISSDTYACLKDKECLDGRLTVLNPFVRLRLSAIKPVLFEQEYLVPFYESAGLEGTDFQIVAEGIPADQNSVFRVSGQGISHDTYDAAIFKLELPDFEEDNRVRICPELRRVNFDIGVNATLIDSDFLVSSSTSVPGYYEYDGFLYSKGPYIFTAKAWLR